MIKETLESLGVEETYLNIIKAMYHKPILNGEKFETFPLKWEASVYFYHSNFNIVLEVLARPTKQEKEIIGKEKVKIPVYWWYNCMCERRQTPPGNAWAVKHLHQIGRLQN